MTEPPQLIKPSEWPREAALPRLGLLPADGFNLDELLAIKQQEKVPVHVVFPVRTSREAENLEQLLAILQPLCGRLIDQIWVAFGGQRLGRLSRLPLAAPHVTIFPARQLLPPDQRGAPVGKGAVMRALLYHLVTRAGVTQPRSVIEFLDADIRPQYFHPGWVVGPVGAVLRYRQVEAAKVVYQRPRGGRLNTMFRSLVALCPHPAIQALQQLVYLLSGEMAGTLRYWTRQPFKSGYGVETAILLSFALDLLQLSPGTADLDHLVQVYIGRMDHRHSPLTSTPRRRGLDQMAGHVFHTLLEVLARAGIGPSFPENFVPKLSIPLHEQGKAERLGWLQVNLGDLSLPPLDACPEVRTALREVSPA
ncbi:MAG: hypothetical protein NTY36_10095 [Deltaproteobacteria bacterium]|nr:hypothetical protein [Deltaproteobacteria bacterium]